MVLMSNGELGQLLIICPPSLAHLVHPRHWQHARTLHTLKHHLQRQSQLCKAFGSRSECLYAATNRG